MSQTAAGDAEDEGEVLWTWDAESAGPELHVEQLGAAVALRADDDEREPPVWEHAPDDGPARRVEARGASRSYGPGRSGRG